MNASISSFEEHRISSHIVRKIGITASIQALLLVVLHGICREGAADFETFTKLLFERLPEAELLVLALKPAPVRWSIVDKVRTTNDLLRAKTTTDKRITFLDGSFNLLLDDGIIREELFVEDRLHLNDDGYKLWANMLAPHLELEKRDRE